MNVGIRKVVKLSKYANVGRMNVKFNIEPVEEVDCLSTWGHNEQPSEDVDVVQRITGACKVWEALKCLLSNRGMGLNEKKCLCAGVIIQQSCVEQRPGE